MINLMPYEYRQNISYARRNTILVRWITALVIGIAGIVIVVVFGLFFLQVSHNSHTREKIEAEESLKLQKLEETQKRVADLSSSLKLVVQVLSRQILFSKLIPQIGAAIPQGAVLTDLGIESVEGGITLSAVATDYRTATQVQVNLQDPQNLIFEKADIESISCSSGNDDSESALRTRYPCQVRIKALFAKNGSYYLLSTQQPTSGVTP